MHARMLQLTVKPGQVKEVAKKLAEKALPLLKQQEGFVHAIAMTSERGDQFCGISIWKTKQDADRWTSGKSQELLDTVIKPFLRQEPTILSFNVEASTIEEMGMGRAAGSD